MPQPFAAASHHDILALLVQLTILLLTARLLGELAQRLGQPSVVGEILAGIILGPSFISGLIPALGEWIIPHTEVQGYLLELVSLIGVMFLLLITGLETDLVLIRKKAQSAIGIALGGLLLPLALGFALGQLLPESLLVNPEDRLVFALFIATAMAISAIPVVAKVLIDLKLTRRDIGQTIIAAAMIDDTTGWIILSVVIGLASGAAITVGSVGLSIVTVLAFMILSLTVGRWLISRTLSVVQNSLQMRDKVLTLIILLMFAWGAIGQALGIEALLGAFVVGIVLSQIPQLNPDIIHKLESITFAIFAPIFFAVAGLKVNALGLLDPQLLLITVIVIVVAIICKMIGVYVGARTIGGTDHWSAIFFGAGLNARGSIGIIVANIGLSLNILNQEMFSIIVVMAVVTSLMSPAVMKWAVRHIRPEDEELDRLRREELKQDNLIANVRRVLLPIRMRESTSPSQLIEAHVLEQISSDANISLTLLTISTPENQAKSTEFLNKLAELFSVNTITKKVLIGDNASELILDEAKKDYDLLILGASENRGATDVLFTPLVDILIRLAPCPTMLVQGQRLQEDWKPKRILVPSNGSQAARRAAEVAFALVGNEEQAVMILHVVEENRSNYHLDSSGALLERQKQIALEGVAKLQELGVMQGIPVQTEVEVGIEPEAVILETAMEENIDLIILGTHVSVGSDRLYLGPRVERILSNATCPVIVINV
jgi:Kef-type K+ transport system membrane component KefB/nucleotide-binding universal stress UspA family protein